MGLFMHIWWMATEGDQQVTVISLIDKGSECVWSQSANKTLPCNCHRTLHLCSTTPFNWAQWMAEVGNAWRTPIRISFWLQCHPPGVATNTCWVRWAMLWPIKEENLCTPRKIMNTYRNLIPLWSQLTAKWENSTRGIQLKGWMNYAQSLGEH